MCKPPNQRNLKSTATRKTHNDDCARGDDTSQQGEGDGVVFLGVHDALVVTVDPPLVRLADDVHDDEGQRGYSEYRNKRG